MNRLPIIFAFLAFFILTACGSSDISTNQASEHIAVTTETSEKEEVTDIQTESVSDEDERSSVAKEDPSSEEIQEDNKSEGQLATLGELRVHYIDVGQADATLMQYSDDNSDFAILFDTGDWRSSNVVTYLNNQNVSYIDLVIISHPDADHIGQLNQVINAFTVGEVWMSGNESSTQTFQRAVESVLESDADYYEPRAGEAFDIGSMGLEVIYPNSITGKSNEESISVLFTYGNVKLLFTGDADAAAENYMRSNFNVDADILQLGHHGSKTSSDPAFIDAVSPSVAIYSAGSNNSYGHPDSSVVSTIHNKDIDLYGTDVNGTIIVTSDGETFNVEPKLPGIVQADEVSDSSIQKTDESTESNFTNQEESNPADVSTSPQSGCININHASLDDVQGIIHIGPERAQDLIELRPFNSVDDLKRISGIGPVRIADIKAEGIACVQ